MEIRSNSTDERPLAGLSILLIEDCEDNQFLFKRILIRQGAKVSLANDGREGLALIGSARFDSVLLDIQMPVMNGLETMARLKSDGFKPPVIALTAYNRDCERKEILDAGFTSIVSKPLEATVLVSTILSSIKALESSGLPQ